MNPTLFAANWKMNHGPAAARDLVRAVLGKTAPREGRRLLFFPPAVCRSYSARHFPPFLTAPWAASMNAHFSVRLPRSPR